MDIFSAFSIFTTPETGVLLLSIISITEFIIKPICVKLGLTNYPLFKKTLLPLIVCMLCIGASFIIVPAGISGIGATILYGFSVGIVANWLYRAGLSQLAKKFGIQEKIQNSIAPPPNNDEE